MTRLNTSDPGHRRDLRPDGRRYQSVPSTGKRVSERDGRDSPETRAQLCGQPIKLITPSAALPLLAHRANRVYSELFDLVYRREAFTPTCDPSYTLVPMQTSSIYLLSPVG